MRIRQKVILPPDLPPEVPDEEIEVSDEDVQFVNENSDYAGLVSKLDTQSVTKHVSRVADAKEGELESLYEKRRLKKLAKVEKEVNTLEVDPVDALPLKTADGKLYYRTVAKEPKEAEVESKDDESISKDPLKSRKAEKFSKLKKLRKEAKKQAKEEVQQTPQPPQAEILDEVEKDLTAEEASEAKKYELAKLGTSLLADPVSKIKNIKEMLEISKDGDSEIVILGLKSLMAVFKDIIPGYRIRLPTENEKEMKVSKAVNKTRIFESTLLSTYKAYVQKLVALQQQSVYKRVATHCICTLLAAVPHFNYYESLLTAVVKNLSSEDDVVRKLCCTAVKSLFTDEAKHGGEVTVEAVKRIAELVKTHNCQLHPDSIEVFLSLSFDEDLGKQETSDMDKKPKYKKWKKGKGSDEPKEMPDNKRKKTRKEMMLKTRDEVNADFKAVLSDQDPQERRRMQSQTLSALFQTYFRILKHVVDPKSEASSAATHPLLAPCLNGIGKFSHLIDLDFMADLMQSLRKLAANGSKLGDSSENSSCQLTVSERLQCCIVAFKVMRINLDALNVDLQEFFVVFYNLILEYRPGRDDGEVLAEALKIMLCDERQHDMQRAAAFIKRLATFSLCFRSAESMAALVTVKNLLQKNAKCRNLLENDAGGGSVAGAIAKFHPHVLDPNLSGALSSVVWELNLLMKHYHPSVSSISTSISTINSSANQIYHSHVSPQQAYMDLSKENDSPAALLGHAKTVVANNKKRKGASDPIKGMDLNFTSQIDENVVKTRLAQHFALLRDIEENERLRSELYRATSSLNLYDQYRKQQKKKRKTAV